MKTHPRILWLHTLLMVIFLCLFPMAANGAIRSLTTLFSGNVTFQGNMFNVTVHPESDIVITAFDIHVRGYTQPVPIHIYWREGGYQGYETNESAWTLLQSSSVTAAGPSSKTPLPLDSGLALSAGKTYGLYITINGN